MYTNAINIYVDLCNIYFIYIFVILYTYTHETQYLVLNECIDQQKETISNEFDDDFL